MRVIISGKWVHCGRLGLKNECVVLGVLTLHYVGIIMVSYAVITNLLQKLSQFLSVSLALSLFDCETSALHCSLVETFAKNSE